MSDYPEIKAKVTSKIDVLIRATQPDVNLDEPFYAINWFSTKTEWLYHFYNFLAVRSVRKIGGIPFFKASVSETILDEEEGRRDLILIVRYPSGQNFMSLMTSTYFKMVSIFRILSVSKFTFGFTHKIEVNSVSKKKDGLHYAIHHFKSDKNGKEIFQQLQEIMPANISVKYGGHIVATLNSQEKNKSVEQIPNLMDGLYIFQANEEVQLREFLESNPYKIFIENLQSSHISLLNRISV